MDTRILQALGQVLAILDVGTPGGIPPSALNNVMTTPATRIPLLMRGASALTPDLHRQLAAAVEAVPDWPDYLPPVDQGSAYLAYHKALAALDRARD